MPTVWLRLLRIAETVDSRNLHGNHIWRRTAEDVLLRTVRSNNVVEDKVACTTIGPRGDP